MKQNISFVATGDSFITRRLPSIHNEDFRNISNIIHKGEFRFTNFEVTAHHSEGFPSAVSGGTWAMTDPHVLEDIQSYGFNTLAWANNHTLDYSYGGLLATEKYLNQYGFVHAGVGKNLSKASAPKYIDCPSGRVALISATSTFHECWRAGEQRSDVEGRPGVNPLRFDTRYTVTEEQMSQLKNIADATDINAKNNLAKKEGFAASNQDQSFQFGTYKFEVGSESGTKTYPNELDMKRILDSISEASRQADYVIVSIHSHEMEGETKSNPSQFLKKFSRSCIDGGAHAIIGHGPHILRGIEIYKERPIFYSLGNFIFQNDSVSQLPQDFYTKYGLGFEHNVADALDKRSNNNQKGFAILPEIWESIIPVWKMKDGKLDEIILYPIDLGYGKPRYERGWPKLATTSKPLKDLQRLSEPMGTKIEIDNNVGYIKNQ